MSLHARCIQRELQSRAEGCTVYYNAASQSRWWWCVAKHRGENPVSPPRLERSPSSHLHHRWQSEWQHQAWVDYIQSTASWFYFLPAPFTFHQFEMSRPNAVRKTCYRNVLPPLFHNGSPQEIPELCRAQLIGGGGKKRGDKITYTLKLILQSAVHGDSGW